MIHRGDVFYITRFPTIGAEQHPGRPALIVSNDTNNKNSSTVEIVYLTTQPKQNLPTHVTIRSSQRESTALCEQITSIDVSKIGDKLCTITEQEMSEIDKALLISLSLKIDDLTTSAATDKIKQLEHELAVYKQLYNELLSKIIEK